MQTKSGLNTSKLKTISKQSPDIKREVTKSTIIKFQSSDMTASFFKYKVVIFLFVCPFITQEPLDRYCLKF